MALREQIGMAEDSRTYTTIFKADVSQFSKSTQDMNRLIKAANSEFKNATAALGKWSDSQEGLNAKLKQLGTTLTAEEQKLANMREEYEKLEREGKANTKVAQDLRNKINEQQATVKGIKSDINHYSKSLQELADAGVETREELDKLNKEQEEAKQHAKDLGGNALTGAIAGIAGIATACVGAVKGMASLVENTKELRTQLAKLEVNANNAGVSVDTTDKAMKDFAATGADADQSLEAVSNLLMSGFNDTSMADAVNTISDAVIAFPSTLSVEGLSDSLQESMSVMNSGSNATGQYAELLERLGYNLDDVTAHYGSLSTEEEKQQYLLGLVKDQLGGTADAYKQNNKDLVDSATAQYEYNKATAELATTVQPAVTAFQTAMVTVLQSVAAKFAEVDIQGLVGKISSAISNLVEVVLPPMLSIITWIIDNISWLAPLLGSLVGIIGGISAAIKIYNTVVQVAKTVQLLWNAALTANPIGIVVMAITGLVAAFVLLWNKCEGFRNFWKKLWDGIKEVAGGVGEAIASIFSGLGGIIKSFINGIIRGVNTAIGWLNKIKIPDWEIFGKYAGKGINIKPIPELAKGGIVDKATIAKIGEAGKEAVVPLENNTGWIDELAKALNTNGVGGGSAVGSVTVNQTFNKIESSRYALHRAKLETINAIKLARGV